MEELMSVNHYLVILYQQKSQGVLFVFTLYNR